MDFQPRSLNRKNIPSLNFNNNNSNDASSGSSALENTLAPKTLKRKNFRGLSLGGGSGLPSDGVNNISDPTALSSGSLSLAIPAGAKAINRRSIQQVTMSSSTPIETNKTLDTVLSGKSMSNLSLGTGSTRTQVITSKVTISSSNHGKLDENDKASFQLNNYKEEDLLKLEDLGAGNSGLVLKVIHTPTQRTMAKKMIHIENNPDVKRQIARELKILNECKLKYIIDFYGLYLKEGNVVICMEYMDIGSLDKVLKIRGAFPEYIINHVAYSVLNGLKYLYTQHKIIHRDIKPSNVLLSSKGTLKLCDFGVSRELIGSVADTFVGTSTYMSPERILGGKYTIKGDIWSLGLMLVELATGFFPFGDNEKIAPSGILDLLQRIVNEPPPNLRYFNKKYFETEDGNMENKIYFPSLNNEKDLLVRLNKPVRPFLESFTEFVNSCLIKEESERPGPSDLLKDEFISIYKKDLNEEDLKLLKNDIKEWCKGVKKMKKN